MIFTYEVSDELVSVCETQILDLNAELTRKCANAVNVLTERAESQARKSIGTKDIPALVIEAGLKSVREIEEKISG